jgi:hypothetical protein
MVFPGCRGQSGLELIVGIAFILMVFYVIVIIAQDKTQESSDTKTFLDARRIAESVKDNINMISEQGPGYYSYFSLPAQIQGGYDYNLSIRGNTIELMWADRTWTANLLTSNITVYCLSLGTDTKNRIMHSPSGIEVACNLPNLRLAPGSLRFAENYTTFTVWNDAHVDATKFMAMFETNNTQINTTILGLPAGAKQQFSYNLTSAEFVVIFIDYNNEANETWEGDNNITKNL